LQRHEKDALYKAYFVEKSISSEEYAQAKKTGVLPEGVLKK